MKNLTRDLVLALAGGVLVSLVSAAFQERGVFAPGCCGGPYWGYYGLPFPVLIVKDVDIVGTFRYFYPVSLAGDIAFWSAISFVVVAAFNASQFAKNAFRNASLAGVGAVLFSLLSMFSLALNPPYLHLYGLPFPIYGLQVAHGPVGSVQYFYFLNAVEDLVLWAGVAFVVVTTLDGVFLRNFGRRPRLSTWDSFESSSQH